MRTCVKLTFDHGITITTNSTVTTTAAAASTCGARESRVNGQGREVGNVGTGSRRGGDSDVSRADI